MAALSEFFSRLYTITVVFFCLLLLEALILFRSVTGTISKNTHKRISTTAKYLQLIEEKNPTILYTKKLSQQSVAAECAVCLSELTEGEYVRKLKCKHTFHRDCLDKWLQQYLATCPLCRTKVLPDEIVADFHRMQDEEGDRDPNRRYYYYYDGSDEEMVLLLSALHGNGLHRIF